MEIAARWGALAVGVILLSYVAEHLAYRETDRTRADLTALVLSRGRQGGSLASLRRPFDLAFGILALVRTWLEVFALLCFIRLAGDQIIICLILACLVASRYRALQEISHFAVHGALGASAATQLLVANIFFQFPLMRISARARRRAHVHVHHRHSNTPGRDPNLEDLEMAGIVPGCGFGKLIAGVLYALWPATVAREVSAAIRVNLCAPWQEVFARTGLVAAVALVAQSVAGWPGILFGLLLPRFIIYPWLAWISQLLEHKWFGPMPDQRPFFREFHAGRATRYGTVTGALVRYFVLPAGDSYHLAHSLFPTLRWNHLSLADRLLSQHLPNYFHDGSHGLCFRRSGHEPRTAFDWLIALSKSDIPGRLMK